MPLTPGTPVVTRFAPSPTGYLHVGGARTALFNWAFARRHGGQFILRIEDTDKARSTAQATRQIIEDLKWLGLDDWDQGPDPNAPDPYQSQKGPHGPYFQSQRGEIYREYLQKLIDSGRAYPDKGAYRFKMPGKAITVHDLVLGDVTIQSGQLEDFVIFKSPADGETSGSPTFHFANVVDDATMGVTHVLRAQEHLMNTPKHVALFEAFGIQPPKYAHMPLIFNPDGSKMSKRDKAKAARIAAKKHPECVTDRKRWLTEIHQGIDAGRSMFGAKAEFSPNDLDAFIDGKNDEPYFATIFKHICHVSLPEIDVHDFCVSGYLAGVLLNYIALLGWSPGQNIEHFDLDYLRREFDLERVGKSPARFDRQKLLAFNADGISKLSPAEFAGKLAEYLAEHESIFDRLIKDYTRFQLFAECYRLRAKTLADPATAGRFFVVDNSEITFDPKAVEKVLNKNDNAGRKVLGKVRDMLANLDPWTPQSIHTSIENFTKANSLGMGDIAQPLRVAVTGTTVSPAIHDTLAILGKGATLTRIDRCLMPAK